VNLCASPFPWQGYSLKANVAAKGEPMSYNVYPWLVIITTLVVPFMVAAALMVFIEKDPL
jgi:hypothetical protein